MPVDESDLAWTEREHGEARFRRKQLSDHARPAGLGCSLYELPPGGRSWPYHYHTANAEAMYVLDGTGTLRQDGAEHPLEPGTYAAFPTGPAGAHRVANGGEQPLRYLVVSTMTDPDVTVYPDSEKLGVYTGSAPGGRDDRPVDGYYRIDDAVDYWEGE